MTVICAVFIQADAAAETPKKASVYILRYDAIHQPVYGANGMVASQNTASSEVGRDILARGGNAIDAAVAMGFSLAVTLPRAGNLGGGGFMLVHVAAENKTVAIDYRGTAPSRAKASDFLDREGKVDAKRSKLGHTSSTVPGTVAGLYAAHQRWGKLPWKTLLQPAIKQASKGIQVNRDLAWAIQAKRSVLAKNPESLNTFFKADGVGFEEGELMRRPQLAKTLKLIAKKGRDGFYRGAVAEKIEKDMALHGGLITRDDLANYEAVVKAPLKGSYRGHDVVTMPPPAGGVHLLQMLNTLEHFPLGQWGSQSSKTVHVLSESMKRAYAYRAEFLGDPDFASVPTQWLMSKTLAADLAEGITPNRATPVAEIKPKHPASLDESADTTHYSIMDSEGNAVSNTYTLSASFGSGVTVKDTGILMNNQINNFALRYGVPGATGARASFANSLAPGKRTKSTQTPIIVFAQGRPWFASGTPGGRRIITTMVQVVSNVIDHGMNIADATHAPRIHQGWSSDTLEHEPGFSEDTLGALRAMGHPLKQGATMGSVQSVLWQNNQFSGAADPRRPNASARGF